MLFLHYNTHLMHRRYLQRDDEELAKLESDRRPGRPRSMREDLLRQQIVVEEREYDAGYWIPDMTDASNLELLREWNGEWASLSTLKFVRLAKNGAKHDSSFPPKGQS